MISTIGKKTFKIKLYFHMQYNMLFTSTKDIKVKLVYFANPF